MNASLAGLRLMLRAGPAAQLVRRHFTVNVTKLAGIRCSGSLLGSDRVRAALNAAVGGKLTSLGFFLTRDDEGSFILMDFSFCFDGSQTLASHPDSS